MRSAALALCFGMLCSCEYDADAVGSAGPTSGTTSGSTSGTTAVDPSTTANAPSTTVLPDTGATVGPPGSSTTGGGSTSDDGSSESTGTPSPLVGEGLLARWFIDEASDGQSPTALLDATMTPLDLSLTYPDRVMSFDEQDGHRGLRWGSTGNSGRPTAPIGGTKIEDELTQAQDATIELVLDVDAVSGLTSRFLHIGPGSVSQLVVGARALDSLEFRWGAFVAREFEVDLTAGRQVIHVVIDTTEDLPSDRIRAYRNGTLLEIGFINVVSPVQGEGIPLTNNASITLGNRSDGQRSFAGRLGYAALYNRPLTIVELAQNADALGESDDTQ